MIRSVTRDCLTSATESNPVSHQHPFGQVISFICGFSFSIFSGIASAGLRAFSLGVVGGIGGLVGQYLIRKLIKFIKEKFIHKNSNKKQ